MNFSLYAAVVPSYRQLLGSVAGLIGKAEAFCAEHALPPDEIVQARLATTMEPFAYQVKSVAVHSLGAIEGVRGGVFRPDNTEPPRSFSALGERIAETLAVLEAIDPAEIDGFVGRDIRFSWGEHHIDYAAEEFLLSFSQPNFYFHAATAYDILRWKGVPLQKGNFLGRTRRR